VTKATAPSYGALPGHRAFAFVDIARNAYAVFRGTSGDDEWADNGQGMLSETTVQQKAALRFIMELKQMPSVRTITAAGHSKGGNKAQYVAVAAPDGYVNRCFSLDGQGFSAAFIKKYKDVINTRKNTITLAAERRDFVNCLGFYLHDGTKYYIGRRENPLPYYHCPDALRDISGNIGPESVMKPISDMLNHWITYFLSELKYAAVWEATVNGVISLMLKTKRASDDETAEALVVLADAFIELLQLDETFRNQVETVFFHESHLLLNTFQTAEQDKSNRFFPLLRKALKKPDEDEPGSLPVLFVEKWARKIIEDPNTRKNFMAMLVSLSGLINKLKKSSEVEQEIFNYIQRLVDNMLLRLAVSAADKMIMLIPDIWRAWRGN
jgi:hypothetical protein